MSDGELCISCTSNEFFSKGNLSVCTKVGGKTMGPMYYLWPVVPLPLCRNNRKKS